MQDTADGSRMSCKQRHPQNCYSSCTLRLNSSPAYCYKLHLLMLIWLQMRPTSRGESRSIDIIQGWKHLIINILSLFLSEGVDLKINRRLLSSPLLSSLMLSHLSLSMKKTWKIVSCAPHTVLQKPWNRFWYFFPCLFDNSSTKAREVRSQCAGDW